MFFYSDFRSDFCLLPVFDAYSGLGHFQSFHARCSWDRSFRRAPLPSACLIAVNGAECFYADLSCGELVKTAPTDTMISNRQSINQSINQCSCLVSFLSPSLVSPGGAWRMLLALRCLISDRFCIIPVGSGIEHFFSELCGCAAVSCLLTGRCSRSCFVIARLGHAARAVPALVMSSAMSS